MVARTTLLEDRYCVLSSERQLVRDGQPRNSSTEDGDGSLRHARLIRWTHLSLLSGGWWGRSNHVVRCSAGGTRQSRGTSTDVNHAVVTVSRSVAASRATDLAREAGPSVGGPIAHG